MPLDPKAVKAALEELEAKSGSDFFLRLKEGDVRDIRVLEPSPAMNGNWYVEVPVWWIDKTRIVSREFIDGVDVVEEFLTQIEADFARTNEQSTFLALRNKTGGKYASEVIRKGYEYWVPVLEFNWELDQDQIVGIYNDAGEYDPALIKKYIVGGKPKILDGKISLIKSINKVVTARGGYDMPDPVKGFNISISRTGTDRKTVYSGTKTEYMPMPSEFYGAKAIDPVRIVKSQIVTDDYVDKVLGNYFYGERLPENPEYMFPELRENNTEEPTQASPRRARASAPAAEAEEPQAPPPATSRATAATPAPATHTRTATPATRSRTAAPAEASAPTPRPRNILEDVVDAD